MRTRTLIALLVALGSVAASLVILFSGGTEEPLAAAVAAGQGPSAALRFQASLPEAIPGNGVVSPPQQVDPGNMTDVLIQSFLKTVGEKNPTGPENGTINLPNEDAVAYLIGLTSGSSTLFTPFTDRDIRIGKDDSPAAGRAYVEAISAKLKARMSTEKKTLADALTDLTNRADSSSLIHITGTTSGYVTDLLEIAAPPSWKVIHLERLNLWKEKAAVYQAIIDRDTDPFRAYIAVSELATIAKADASLSTLIMNRYEEITK